MFFTDYSMGPAELAVRSRSAASTIWAPEAFAHRRRSRALFENELPKRYYDVMDPFVTATRCRDGMGR